MFRTVFLFIILKCLFFLPSNAQDIPSPKNDGWDSEFLSDEIQKQFYKIISHARDGKDFHSLINDQAQMTAFNSEELVDLRNDEQVTIQKWNPKTSSKKLVVLTNSFANFIGLGQTSSEYKFKIKVSHSYSFVDGEK